MDLLVTYDVSTVEREGRRRLRKVAKICEGYGQRVQLSVFECRINETQEQELLQRLRKEIDLQEDSLRVYRLHGGREGAVRTFGRDGWVDLEGPLIL